LEEVETQPLTRVAWIGCEELREWTLEDAEDLVKASRQSARGGCSLRIPNDVFLKWPPSSDDETPDDTASMVRSDGLPITGIRVRARAPKQMELGGLVFQRGATDETSLATTPALRPVLIGPDWAEHLFWFSDSPHFDGDRPTAVIVIGSNVSAAVAAGSGPPPRVSEGYWEVAQIELVTDGPPVRHQPGIEALDRESVAFGDRVTMKGVGFETRCEFNAVFLADEPQRIIACTETAITFEARALGSVAVTLRSPGGKRSAARSLTVHP
jgi:hypothetical protein